MRKSFSILIALGAIALTLPAAAQSLSVLSISQNAALGGEMLTARFSLTAPMATIDAATAFSLSPAVVVLESLVSIQSGAISSTFRLQTLPVDTPVSAMIGVALHGATLFTQVTVLPRQPFYTRFLTFRRDSSVWTLRDNADGSVTNVQFGEPGDQPLPLILDPGATAKQLVLFRPSTAQWFVRGLDGNIRVIQFGAPGDIPAPSNYLGTNRTQIAVLRPSTRQLFIRDDNGATITVSVPFTEVGDQPVTNDFLGLGRAQFAVYRGSTGEWIIRQDDGTPIRIQWGQSGDHPVMADFLGLKHVQMAVYRPSTGVWHIRKPDGSDLTVLFGLPTDVPRPGDFLGLGRDVIAVARPGTGEWFVRNDTGDAIRIAFGDPGVEFVPDWFTPKLAPH